jgi:predicted RND superfamily exporter protein
MRSYQESVLKHFGYTPKRGCGTASICPALSLTDLFDTKGGPGTSAEIRRLLAAVPPYFSRAAITADHKRANLAFGIRLMPLDRQQEVIQEMRRRLDPPKGVTAELAGLPVLAAEANDKLASPWRRLGLLVLGLLAVGLALWVVFRSVQRAVVPLVPIALATGWAGLVVAPIELNPMSATLGALVIAIATEFSVLLAERFRQERAAGLSIERALARAYASTGVAVVASGLTAIAGFAVLAVSEIAMVRNFGLVTVLDLAVALGGVLLVLPAVLVLDERGELLTLPRRAARQVADRLPRRRRDASVA